MKSLATQPIDAVITWVDGHDPAHRTKRARIAAAMGRPLHPNGTNPHRWDSADELTYCLQSLDNHAPWLRAIWIVTDGQTPAPAAIPPALAARVQIVDHKTIFRGFEQCLPCFNSLAIESLLWRIPDLATRFLYFNDDVFLTAPLRPDHVFDGLMPRLRGKWVDYSALDGCPEKQADPALLNHFTQLNAAQLMGFSAGRLWDSAHVVHPLNKDVMARLYAQHEAAFGANIAHPFRDISQFQPMALHNHACLRDGQFSMAPEKDYLHLRSGAVVDFPLPEVRHYLRRSTSSEIRFLCVNNLPELHAALPDARSLIEQAICA